MVESKDNMQPEIKLYNTLTREIEAFSPITKDQVKIYSCGPTVYHYAHLGNLRGYVFTDIVRRMFLYAGYDVHAVINITDVGHNVTDGDEGEDKMEKGAKREGKDVWEIAKFYSDAYFKDLDLLNIDRTKYDFPRATDTIQEQIALVKALEEKGYTYTISDGVYFDTSKFAHYADLARLDIEGLKSGARVEENKEKRNITDFALWKFSPQDEKRQMEWDSPWGTGFPGWHIECSAMSKKYLGNHFDIHIGGIDHIPVHHTNEIAQSECANGEKYVNYWLHYNFLNDPTGKMSKSKGEFLRLETVINEGIDPLAYRYYLLTVHYRSEIQFSLDALRAQNTRYQWLINWCRSHHLLRNGVEGNIIKYWQDLFNKHLFNDLGTPSAVAILGDMIQDKNFSEEDRYSTLLHFDKVLGLGFKDVKVEEISIPENVQELLNQRKLAREQKDFTASDRLRDEIKAHGFEVRDDMGGQTITKLTS